MVISPQEALDKSKEEGFRKKSIETRIDVMLMKDYCGRKIYYPFNFLGLSNVSDNSVDEILSQYRKTGWKVDEHTGYSGVISSKGVIFEALPTLPIEEKDKDLERRIEERRQEAKNKKIWEKANAISLFLGMEVIQTVDGETHSVYKFYRPPFSIEIIGSYTSISYDRKLVYEGSSSDKKGISRYVPGEWLKEFASLYVEAEEAAQRGRTEAVAKVAMETKEREEELKGRFGLE